MPQWVRTLDQSTKDAAEWHVPRTKSFTTTTNCGKVLAGTIEVASDDKAEHEGRCRQCVTSLGPQKQTPVKRVKKTAAKKSAAKRIARKPAPRRRKA